MLRDLGGVAGVGLLASAAFGGAFGWASPLAYLIITEGALAGSWAIPGVWPARPPHDVGGALCTAIAFAAGTAIITVRGDRDHTAR